MFDVRPIAAVHDLNDAAEFGMLAEFLDDARRRPPAVDFFRQQTDRPVEADGEDLLEVFKAGVSLFVLDEGSVAPKTRGDRFAGLRMRADFARQREEG